MMLFFPNKDVDFILHSFNDACLSVLDKAAHFKPKDACRKVEYVEIHKAPGESLLFKRALPLF